MSTLTNLVLFNAVANGLEPDLAVTEGIVKHQQEPLLKRAAVGGYIKHVAGTGLIETRRSGAVIIELPPQDPAVVMKPKDAFAATNTDDGLKKPDWHNLFKDEAGLAKVLRGKAPGMSEAEIQAETQRLETMRQKFFPGEAREDFQANRRIFGMGVMAIVEFEDGPHALVVKRYVPQADQSGALNADKYSRAAGSAAVDLFNDQFEELGQELYVAVDRKDHIEMVTFAPTHDFDAIDEVPYGVISRLAKYREKRLDAILADPNMSSHPLVTQHAQGKPIKHTIHPMQLLDIPEMSKEVRYTRADGAVRTMVGYVHDSPKEGDLNIDAIGVVKMPGVHSSQVIGLIDDEMTNPRREWYAIPVPKLAQYVKEGRWGERKFEMSPAPAALVRKTDIILPAIENMRATDDPVIQIHQRIPAQSSPLKPAV